MPQITYTVERTKAMAASAAFNFPDRNTMSFTCKIKLCMNSDLECNNLTPPNCNGKRAKSASNGNFNEDTSGESSARLNATETPLPPSASTTPLSIITKTNVKQRVEVSGDVIPETEFGTTMEAITATSTNKHKQDLKNEERIEEKTENSRSTLSSSTTGLRFSSSTSTESTRSDRIKPTIKEESGEEQQRPSSSTTRSSSSIPRSSSSTTTSEGSEQLLSSVERMNSASAENSRETVASSTWSSSSTTEGIPLPPTLIATFHTTNSNNIISSKKDEFPQPDLLLHKDKAMLVPHERKIPPSASKTSNRMDEAVERADPNWTVSAEEVKQEEEKEKKENDEVFNGTTKPVQVFDKRSGNEAKSAARSQRDTTRGPPASLNAGDGKRAHNRRRGTHEVDFDISSPELMIMDDYEPAAAAQRGSIQRSSIQEAPFIDWSTQERGNNTVVCLSPIAIISGGLLLLLLLLIMLVILMRVMRKNRGSSGTLMEHSLYSS
ncbi:unnamed protein product [Meloidogyne enterolobii]|uniref:Uncharacterized protein n=1 Tax=Meloidogyne enterolobii TaxID=390850 RepID=A0ACB1AV75_MELEN